MPQDKLNVIAGATEMSALRSFVDKNASSQFYGVEGSAGIVLYARPGAAPSGRDPFPDRTPMQIDAKQQELAKQALFDALEKTYGPDIAIQVFTSHDVPNDLKTGLTSDLFGQADPTKFDFGDLVDRAETLAHQLDAAANGFGRSASVELDEKMEDIDPKKPSRTPSDQPELHSRRVSFYESDDLGADDRSDMDVKSVADIGLRPLSEAETEVDSDVEQELEAASDADIKSKDDREAISDAEVYNAEEFLEREDDGDRPRVEPEPILDEKTASTDAVDSKRGGRPDGGDADDDASLPRNSIKDYEDRTYDGKPIQQFASKAWSFSAPSKPSKSPLATEPKSSDASPDAQAGGKVASRKDDVAPTKTSSARKRERLEEKRSEAGERADRAKTKIDTKRNALNQALRDSSGATKEIEKNSLTIQNKSAANIRFKLLNSDGNRKYFDKKYIKPGMPIGHDITGSVRLGILREMKSLMVNYPARLQRDQETIADLTHLAVRNYFEKQQ